MKIKIKNLDLIIFALIFLFIQYGLKNPSFNLKSPYYKEMIIAANKMKTLTEEIKKEKLNRRIEIDRNVDINMTGLMGIEWSGISTTLGNEEAKRSSINPDFAALVVKKLKELKLQSGDIVAVNMSSSFPALNLAVISALDTLNLKGIIINSVGSSNYGGNIEEFNYLDMEKHLISKKMIKNHSIAYSLGGIDDIGKEFELSTIENIKEKNRDLKFFYNKNFTENLEERYQFYKNYGQVKAFINVGGNLLSLGKNTSEIISNSNVILDEEDKKIVKGGLIGKFIQDNIPILYLLNVKSLCMSNGIPFDPTPLPEIGISPLYFRSVSSLYYNVGIVILFLIFIIKNSFFHKNFK